MLGLCCSAGFSLVAVSRGLLSNRGAELLTAVASPDVEHVLQGMGLL